METFRKIMAVILAMILGVFISAYVTVQLWEWFVVPTFELNLLRLVEAMGLTLMFGYMSAKQINTTASDNYWIILGSTVVYLILMSVFILFTDWILQMFM